MSAVIIPWEDWGGMTVTAQTIAAPLSATPTSEAERIDAARAEIERVIAGYLADREPGPTVVPNLAVARLTAPMAPMTYLFEPSLCISARGLKRILMGEVDCCYDEDHFLLTAVGLPTITEVAKASPAQPYVALQLTLDLDIARQIIGEIDAGGLGAAPAVAGIVTGPVTADLIGAVARLVRLLETPSDIPFLHAMIHREILFRVLTGPGGERLRQIVRIGSDGDQIARAVTWLRSHFAEKLRIEDLARRVGMGLSTFHHHFREITTMSPLQFQKLLRLHEARRRLLADEIDAATAAYDVGYQSVTQFSREYSRLFGAPPIRDVKRLRGGAVARG